MSSTSGVNNHRLEVMITEILNGAIAPDVVSTPFTWNYKGYCRAVEQNNPAWSPIQDFGNKIFGLPEDAKHPLSKTFESYKSYDADSSHAVTECKEMKIGQFLILMGGTGVGKTHLAIATAKNLNSGEITDENIVELRHQSIIKKAQRHLDEFFKSYDDIAPDLYVTTANPTIGSIYALKYLCDNRYYSRKPGIKAKFVNVPMWLTRMNEAAFGKGKGQEFEDLLGYDLVILDDLGAERLTGAKAENLYTLVDLFSGSKDKSLIVTSNLNASEINEILEPRVASRLFESGRSIALNLHLKDYRIFKGNAVGEEYAF